jgi:hypothetical protein
MVGVSMMIMGSELQEINDHSVEPRAQQLAREELRKKRLGTAETWKEVYALLFSFFSFLVRLLNSLLTADSLGRWGCDF